MMDIISFPAAKLDRWVVYLLVEFLKLLLLAQRCLRATGVLRLMTARRSILSVIALLLAFGAAQISRERNAGALDTHSEFREMLLAHIQIRPSSGRMVGEKAYAPYEGMLGERLPKTSAVAVMQEFAQGIKERNHKHRLADQALIKLIEGEVEEAVARLETAVSLDPDDPLLWTDLSASYIALADTKGDAASYIKALSAADKALDRRPVFLEALFNRAVALEKLYLRGAARRAWGAFGALESNPGWVAEARSHWVILSQDPVALWNHDRGAIHLAIQQNDSTAMRRFVVHNPRQVSAALEDDFLTRLVRTTDRSRFQELQAAGTILADELNRVTGDHFWMRVFEALEGDDRGIMDPFLLTYSIYATSRMAYKNGDYEQAAEGFQQAYLGFQRLSSPLELRALFWRGCSLLSSDRRSALEIFEQLEGLAGERKYTLMLGETLWMLGLSSFLSGDPAEANQAYRRALEIFAKARDFEGEAAIHDLLSEVYDYQGAVSEAWAHRYRALHLAHRGVQPETLYRLHTLSGVSALRLGESQVSLYFQEEAVRDAEYIGSPIPLSAALFWQARFASKAGRPEEAARIINRSERAAAAITSESARTRAVADVLLARAEMTPAQERKIQLLSSALEHAEKSEYLYTRLEILLLRARAFLAEGLLSKAESDLMNGVELIEAWRSRTEDVRLRISFFDAGRSMFEEMIALKIKQGEELSSLGFVERGRARGLLDWIQQVPPGMPPLENRWFAPSKATEGSISSMLSDLPEDVVVITYANVRGNLLVWLSGRKGVMAFKVLASQGEAWSQLLQVSRRHVDSLERGVALYDLLIRPLREHIPEGSFLIFNCDNLMGRVPFAALRDSVTGRYLIEDYAFVITPSIAVYMMCAERADARWRSRGMEEALVVGDPYNADTKHGFRRLPGAVAEARSIMRLYPRSRMLLGKHATVSAFVRGVDRADVIHFAGHTRLNLRAPLWSHLVLAPDPDGGNLGFLYAQAIHRMTLARAPVVILSTCSSAKGQGLTSEGAETLARAFLAAGAPAVVASLWSVGDGEAKEVMVKFHQDLVSSGDPATALRNAQLSAILSPDSRMRRPSSWAAFQVFGGMVPQP